MAEEIIRTVCEGCMSGCGVLVHKKEGKVVRITGDPDHPQNRGKLCIKGVTYDELLYHPDRIKHPMKRVGERGDGKWIEISWDQALDEIAEKFTEISKKYGPEAITLGFGTYPKGGVIPTFIFCQAIGSPQHMTIDGPYCFTPHIMADVLTYGINVKCEQTGAYFYDSKAIVLWGHNMAVSFPPKWWRIQEAQKRGARLIVIDPRKNEAAEAADLWLQVKPSTDNALALGWLNVIIKKKLYDEAFLREWTNAPFLARTDDMRLLREDDIRVGGRADNYVAWDLESDRPVIYRTADLTYEEDFRRPALTGTFEISLLNGKQVPCEPVWQRLIRVVEPFTPERVEEITWVPSAQIIEAATTYATSKPAVLMTHMGITMQTNVIQTSRLLSLLIAITGNFDAKEGNGVVQYPISSYLEMSSKILRADRQVEEKQIGAAEYPLFSGPDSIRAKVHPGLWYKDLEEGKMIKALWTSSNPVVHSEDSTRVIRAMKKLELLVVVDFFRTPTADIADYILPPACWLERDDIADTQNYPNFIAARQKVVDPVGECRDEYEILFDVLERMGVPLPFPEPIKTPKDLYDLRLKKLGITFEELKKRGVVSVPLMEKKYEKGLLRSDGRPGLETPTGKCEIWSTRLEEFGYSPLPYYEDTYPAGDILEDYPLILTDGRKLEIYHGLGLTLPSRRKRVPEPIVEVHPETAEGLGIREGEWVSIETHQNNKSFRRKVVLAPHLHPKVIWCNTHFHYPEKRDLNERLEPNINLSHTLDGPLDPIDGASQIRGVPCRIIKG
ncbi:MAG: molybdopterin-dependent oxidoreductase [Deltaproteobacteria bacterium]|nr:molybdopterin-dependent oxidoreductase [Deltaproteobacteria bacterium]